MARGDRGGREEPECPTPAGARVGRGDDDSSCEDEGVAGTVICNLDVTRRINDGFMVGDGFVVGGNDLWILVFDL